MGNGDALRIFLAVEPPAEILQEIGKIQERLQRSCPFEIRWVKPAGMHLTLKFFGYISAEEVLAITRVVEQFTPAVTPLHLEVKGLGVFPSLKRPRVLWIGLTGDVPPLVVLQKNLEEGFAGCGFPKEERRFQPHLTLGRIKSSRYTGDPEKFLQQHGTVAAGEFLAGGLSLFKSDLTSQGAVYTRLGWFPFHQQ